MGGVLYGLSIWRSIAAMVSIDGVLRLVLVATVLQFTDDMSVIAWAVAAPFVLTPLLVWPFIRRNVVNRTELDVGSKQLAWNVARTVVGSSSTGVLVSGFPLLLGATSGDASEAALGALVLAITLTRAPIVIAVLSLQSYLVIHFRQHGATIGSALTRILALIAGASILLAALALWFASPLLVLLVGSAYEINNVVLALLVGSAGLVAALCATGPAVLARSQHMIFTAGWVVAAVTTILLLLLPGTLETRAIVALSAGPLLGLLVHLSGFWRPVAVGRNASDGG
ncbi:hypothetical protein QMG61_14130 [Cryobacterium sp. PH31-AA6]|uniref:hypothetical protein n=1 Tax=Cryobacterium sp. PH31-AA6 TaxID=3046205 RepID=UPI0024B8F363|nr:hypothetical protein [Cryobacterium sp. PH31-AA6]MDJ0324898.1 hypothetical protein [Cryobacterium sp. PH31-AA6]